MVRGLRLVKPFAPNDIGGCLVWLNAKSLPLGSGEVVWGWPELGPAKRVGNVTGTAPAVSLVDSRKAVNFNDYYSPLISNTSGFPAVDDATVFALLRIRNYQTYHYWQVGGYALRSLNGGGSDLTLITFDNVPTAPVTINNVVLAPSYWPVNETHLCTARFSVAGGQVTGSVYLDGELLHTATVAHTAGNQGYAVDNWCSYNFYSPHADWFEFVAYGRDIGIAAQRRVERHLAQSVGLMLRQAA